MLCKKFTKLLEGAYPVYVHVEVKAWTWYDDSIFVKDRNSGASSINVLFEEDGSRNVVKMGSVLMFLDGFHHQNTDQKFKRQGKVCLTDGWLAVHHIICESGLVLGSLKPSSSAKVIIGPPPLRRRSRLFLIF